MNAAEKKEAFVKTLDNAMRQWHDENKELFIKDVEIFTQRFTNGRTEYIGLRVTIEVNWKENL